MIEFLNTPAGLEITKGLTFLMVFTAMAVVVSAAIALCMRADRRKDGA